MMQRVESALTTLCLWIVLLFCTAQLTLWIKSLQLSTKLAVSQVVLLIMTRKNKRKILSHVNCPVQACVAPGKTTDV